MGAKVGLVGVRDTLGREVGVREGEQVGDLVEGLDVEGLHVG